MKPDFKISLGKYCDLVLLKPVINSVGLLPVNVYHYLRIDRFLLRKSIFFTGFRKLIRFHFTVFTAAVRTAGIHMSGLRLPGLRIPGFDMSDLKDLLQNLYPLHAQNLEQSHSLSGAAPGPHIPGIFFKKKLHRLCLPPAHIPILPIVVKSHYPSSQNSLSDLIEQLSSSAAPIRKVYGDPAYRICLKKCSQLFKNFPLSQGSRLLHAGKGSQDLLLFFLGKQTLIQHKAIHQPDPSAFSPAGINRNARHGQAFHIPVDCPLGNLKALCQLLRRHGSPVH